MVTLSVRDSNVDTTKGIFSSELKVSHVIFQLYDRNNRHAHKKRKFLVFIVSILIKPALILRRAPEHRRVVF